MDADTLASSVAALPPDKLVYVDWQRRWTETARPSQIPPDTDWSECGYLAGRGFGKTRVGAEWLGQATYEDPSGLPVYVICPTLGDVKRVAFYGESGLMSVIPPDLIIADNKSDLTITMRNCAGKPVLIQGFSAENPERLRGPQACRAWCFIAGTMVATPAGERPIESLQAGDLVLTRAGPRRVLANSSRQAVVGAVEFSHGGMLVGTADHPVYTAHGWTRLDRLRAGDGVCVIGASSGAAGAGIAMATATTSARTSPFDRSARFASTASAGLRRLARYLTAGTCITATRTRATTTSAIWSACRTAITSGITFFRSPSRRITSARPSNTHASTAERASSERGVCPTRSASDASRSAPTPSALSGECAGTAASLSNLGWELSAASAVSTWRRTGRQSVYCLKVEGEPEYFANGVLVHNCDELAAWQYDEETWDMAMMGLRLGANPQVLWTTTPKPKELIRKLSAPQAKRVIVRGSTFDNKANLPDSFFRQLEQYEGTTLGRQELHGELIDPEESGIIKRSWMRLWPAKKPLPKLDWIIMSLDTAYTEKNLDTKGDPDPTACGVWGLFHHEKRTNVILLDCWEDHLGLPDLIRRVKKERNVAYGDDEDSALIKPMFGSHKPMTSGRKPDILLIEDKGSGISLRQMLHEADIEAYAYNPGRADKLSRLHIVSPIFAQKRVWLPESQKHTGRPRTWAEPLVAQLCSFTGEGSIKHDDHVDQTTQALRLMMDKGLLSLIKPPNIDSAPPPRYKPNPYAA